MIHEHVHRLRSHPIYGSCLIRVFIEANMSPTDADRVADMLRHPRYRPESMDIVCEVKDRVRGGGFQQPGVFTTHSKKEAFAEELGRNIDFMHFARLFVCQGQPEVIQRELYMQLASFRVEVVGTADPDRQLHAKIIVTGKSSGKKDDLVMALCIALFHMFRSIHGTEQADQLFRQRCFNRGIQLAIA
jgi:hypothetical protein